MICARCYFGDISINTSKISIAEQEPFGENPKYLLLPYNFTEFIFVLQFRAIISTSFEKILLSIVLLYEWWAGVSWVMSSTPYNRK